MIVTESTLEAEIIKRVKDFIKREAPRVRDQDVTASIEFSLSNPAWDEDETLVLGLHIRETSDTRLSSDEHCLRVEGLAGFTTTEEEL